MNLLQGNLYWNKDIEILKTYSYITKDRKCDVLVIGGGINGALTAYYQAKQGNNVIIVEKNIVGYGSTVETNGVLESRIDLACPKTIKSLDTKSVNKCNKLCLEAINEIEKIIEEMNLEDELKQYIYGINFERRDLLIYSDKLTSKMSMYKEYEKIEKEGENIKYVEQDPNINIRTGIILANGAASINPYAFTQVLFKYLSNMKNVEVYESTSIENILSREDKVECLTNNRFKIYSKKVILSTGIYSLKYLKDIDVDIYKTFNIITEPLMDTNSEEISAIAKDISLPCHVANVTLDKRLIFSGEDIKETEKLANLNYFKHFANERYKKLYNTLIRNFVLPEDIKIRNCFHGLYLNTKDNLPIIDEIENMPNVYCNLGIGKNGIVYSLIGAKMLQDVCKEYHIKDMYMFRINR